jgi:hypothetical protein
MREAARVMYGPADRHKSHRRSERGRVCIVIGCSTILSTYNKASECSVHELPKGAKTHKSAAELASKRPMLRSL